MKDFQTILKEKREYSGNTEAAIEFAAEEYHTQGYLEGWNAAHQAIKKLIYEELPWKNLNTKL